MEDNEPLTRAKGSKLSVPKLDLESDTEINLEVAEPKNREKPKKPRPPKSQAQLDAFKKALDKRRENIAIKKESKKVQAARTLLEHEEKNKPEPDAEEKPDRLIRKTKTKKQIIIEESESEPEPEVIFVKKSKSTKSTKSSKPKKQIIIESTSESELESESESDSDIVVAKTKKSFGSSHQRQRPKIQIQQPVKPKYNFFTD
jgi:hypothetical protein